MSSTYLERLVDCSESGDVFVSCSQKYEIIEKYANDITLQEVNARISEIHNHFVKACEGTGTAAIFAAVPDGGENGEHMTGFSEIEAEAALGRALEHVGEYLESGPTPGMPSLHCLQG